MWGPIAAAFFLAGIFAIHTFWKRKFARAVASKENELAQIRDRQREAVNKSEAQQRALLDSMIEGLLLLDNSGRIRLANRALENLFGLNSGIYGKTILEAFKNQQLAELAGRLQLERQILGFEIQLSGSQSEDSLGLGRVAFGLAPSGVLSAKPPEGETPNLDFQIRSELQSRWFQINASIIDGDGKPSGSIFVFHDLTRLKQLENTRQEFVANVSHELRTPLSMIKGYVETLLDGAKDDPEVAGKFLQTIERHTDRLTFLIEDLLTISKLESRQIVLNFQPVELFPAVQKVIHDLQLRADEKRVKLENQIPIGLFAEADSDRLEQVFWNLIDNAIKYGRADGKVTISAGTAEEDRTKISVADDGDGIPADVQERIFERFYRIDRARSRETGGTGLGLAIVKHIIQAHDGKIWIESAVGHGSTFHFTLARGAD